MRLFTAIDVPTALRTRLSSLQEEATIDARWTSPDQFHVTLRFIGEVDETQADRFQEVLSEIDVAPVTCSPYGLDVLPSRRAPRVLMLGLDRTDSILELYEAVSGTLESEGLDPEGRRYRPHVTIGRLDDVGREAVHSFLQAHEDRTFASFEVDRFVLYQSTLTAEGAIHEPYFAYELSP